MHVIPAIADRLADHTRWRRDIHAHPELAFDEHRTAAFVAERLADFGIEPVTGIGRTGVVGTLSTRADGPAIGLRADMDALPLAEENDFGHRSRNGGVMHACGHDGHTAMLLAAAEYLARERNFDGTVHFVFQPAEEGEAGARAMMDDGLFERWPMDAVFGLHNWPGMEVGRIALRAGPMMAAMDLFDLVIKGRGGHGAMPHQTADPIVAASQVIQAWQAIVSRNVNPVDAAVISVCQLHAGDAYSVTPERATLRGTTRSFKPAVGALIEARMLETAQAICGAAGCAVDWRYQQRFPPTINSTAESERAIRAATALVGAANVVTDNDPSTGAEDFGYMLQEKPGCYAWMGNGPGEGGCLLHSPHYDFNDAIIPLGASYWVALTREFLPV